jgi:hypothetical protein
MRAPRPAAGARQAHILWVCIAAITWLDANPAQAQRRSSRARRSAKAPATAPAVHAAYAEHPLVGAVAARGYLTVVERERVLSERFPADRAWAVLDAAGQQGVRRHDVDGAMVRALRGKHTVGPSGAGLKQTVPATTLTAREAFALGWLRRLRHHGDSAALAATAGSIRGAGARQLLAHAVGRAPGVQAYRVALADVDVTLARSRSATCDALRAFDREARAAGDEAVRVGAIDALRATRKRQLGRCDHALRRQWGRPISLPAPRPEASATRAGPDTTRRGRRDATRPASDDGPVVFAAPFFKGYLDRKLVRELAARRQLHADWLAPALTRDSSGDEAIAALNAALLGGRSTAEALAGVAWQAVLRRYEVGADAAASVRVDQLGAVEAATLAYARAAAGMDGPPGPQQPASAPAITAGPDTLFARARGKLPTRGHLAPVLEQLWLVERDRRVEACLGAKRAEALAFVVGRGQLPEAAARALGEALSTVQAACPSAARR